MTDGEVRHLLGSWMGGLAQIHDIDSLRSIVKFIAETDSFWKALSVMTTPEFLKQQITHAVSEANRKAN